MSTNTLITPEEIARALQDIRRPDFRIWVRWAYAQGQLDLLAQGIIMSGQAGTNEEAILYMAEQLKDSSANGNSNGSGKITWGDITKTRQNGKLQRQLSELVTGEKIYGEYDLSRIHGTIGHNVIPQLFSGKLISWEGKKRKPAKVQSQLDFFSDQPVLDLFKPADSRRMVRRKTVDQAIALWNDLGAEMENNPAIHYDKKSAKLRDCIIELFGDHALKILNHRILEDEYLSFLTFMTWAASLASYKIAGESFNLFTEIPIFPYSGDFSAGRIDALSVLRINRESLTSSQKNVLDKMSGRQFASVGHLIRDLKNTFGAHLDLVIRDWKFAVGDGPQGMRRQANILKYDDMKKSPLPEHESQIRRYLSTAMLSYSLACKKDIDDAERLWESKSFDLKGQIIYLTPDNYPIIHEVSLSPEEIKSVFQEQVVANFTSAERRSLFKRTGNALMKHAVKLLNGKNKIAPSPEIQLAMEEILSSVEPKNAPQNSVSAVVEKYRVRKFKDENGVIEVMGLKQGKEILEMHLDRLFKAIEDGKVEMQRHFDWTKGGLVNCLVHEEKTASMSISLSRGIFKCFGCGASGGFAPLSVPDDVQVLIKPASLAIKDNSATGKIIIPPRHQEIMSAAQILLQQSYSGSKGVDYLARERGLDPEISFSIGAGFGAENLISGLLEMGFSYAELIHYGFLKVSEKISENHRIVAMLKHRGFSLEEIIRPVFRQEKRGDELKRLKGLPYSVLDNRVTYPLDIGGIVNNFYGRSVNLDCPAGLKHVKLSNKQTDEMPHGAFNLARAMQSGSAELIVEEAPINADTLFQISDHKAVTAILGVNNRVLWEELASFPGDIIISFNYDKPKIGKGGKQTGETGQRNTIALRESLRAKGFKGKIYDFTAGFMQKNPGISYKDPNKYWTTYQKPISVSESVKNA